jgi:N-glycosidase YbiA
MPNGGCLKCGTLIFQGLKPHYCEKCLAELGLRYDHDLQKRFDEFKSSIHFYHKDEPYFEFTNFAPFPIELGGKVWPTSEHYFQAQKHAGGPLEEDIRRSAGPREAFRLGRSQRPRSDWAKIKDIVMYRAVQAKFIQYPGLRVMLLSTGDAELVEHTANDDYWGDGGDGSGRNMLGCILMLIREEIRDSDVEPGAF